MTPRVRDGWHVKHDAQGPEDSSGPWGITGSLPACPSARADVAGRPARSHRDLHGGCLGHPDRPEREEVPLAVQDHVLGVRGGPATIDQPDRVIPLGLTVADLLGPWLRVEALEQVPEVLGAEEPAPEGLRVMAHPEVLAMRGTGAQRRGQVGWGVVRHDPLPSWAGRWSSRLSLTIQSWRLSVNLGERS